MNRRPARAAVFVALGAGLALGLGACAPACGKEPPASSTPTAGQGGRPATSAAVSTRDAGRAAAPCEPIAPPGLPAGWKPYTAWSCQCSLYVPASIEDLPEPIGWQPCPPSAAAAGLDCREMVADWLPSFVETAIPKPKLFRDGEGRLSLALRRNAFPFFTTLVAEVDGPVHEAMMAWWDELNDPGCMPVFTRASGSRWLAEVVGHDALGSYSSSAHEGAIGGVAGALAPEVLVHYEDGLAYNWSAGDKWIGSADSAFRLFVRPWDDPAHELAVASQASDPEGHQLTDIVMAGEAVFYKSSTAHTSGINVWREAIGPLPFVRYLGDATRGAKNFGTDGIDMVWSYGEGKAPSDFPFYPVRKVMAAPFTSDPAALAPRVLRDDPGAILGNEPWEVGCGHAVSIATDPNTVLVVRLADGWAWQIPHLAELTLYEAVGVSCDEVFATGWVEGVNNLVRIRLDSLGPGTAPEP